MFYIICYNKYIFIKQGVIVILINTQGVKKLLSCDYWTARALLGMICKDKGKTNKFISSLELFLEFIEHINKFLKENKIPVVKINNKNINLNL